MEIPGLKAAALSQPRTAPGPRGHWLLGNIPEFRRDVLSLLMDSTAKFGDIVRFRLGPQIIHLLNHPDYVEHVLQRRHSNYDKNPRSAAVISRVTGESLLTSNGEVWQRQRRLLQPAFHHSSIMGFARTITGYTKTMLDRWEGEMKAGDAIDLASEMMRLTFTIVAKVLFSTEIGCETQVIDEAMKIILPETFGRLGRILNCPDWLPTPRNRRFQRALQSLDNVVTRIIADHRAAHRLGQPMNDLLGMLLNCGSETDGAQLNDRQLRNETITFLLAGHETTANALTWTFYLLAQHDDVAQSLRAELRSVLGGKPPELSDLTHLGFLKCVIKEAMRLYPPIWIIERRVIADDQVGGYALPKGSAVVISPYSLHRHPAFWDSPHEFNPGRFRHPPPPAYIPFGAGPRFCIGSEFAMLEAQLIVAIVLPKFQIALVPGHPVRPLPGITLRTEHGLRVTLSEPNP
jgi:cytochrome P450